MTQEQITSGNKLIAEFMGWKYAENDLLFNSGISGNSVFSGWIKNETEYTPGVPVIVVSQNRRRIDYRRTLNYHSSWDWLMPVVEKIEEFGCSICLESREGNRTRNRFVIFRPPLLIDRTGKTKIEAVWEVVVEFIEWYNKRENKL